jgi:hypothetical protein
MKIFHCDHCGQLVFFENTQCLQCGHRLAYLPGIGQMGSLESLANGLWHSPAADAAGTEYRLCANYTAHDVCNWAVDASDGNPLCLSCRLTRVIPDLAAGHREAWYRLEVAKRRLLYSLLKLRLPVTDRQTDPSRGLAFELVADASGPQPPVVTRHCEGVITINVAEADDAERERRRIALNEPYRTLLGHFRHEVGHYYWDRLVKDSERLEAFRALFGDERQDYAAALQAYYEKGPRQDWQARFVSAYATMHPWEDWAETWAHYLHVTDTVETAAACGIALRPRRAGEPVLEQLPTDTASPDAPIDRLIESWFPLTYLLNNLNRALGLPDGYPFVLSAPAIEKMRFVHDTVGAGVASRPASTRVD